MSKIIEAKNLSYSYQFQKPVFEKISFDVNQGDFFGVLGPNGAGKTTIIEMLISMRWPDTGNLFLFGVDSRSPKREFLNKVSFLSHDIQLNSEQTIESFLIFHSFYYEKYSKELESDLLNYFELDKNKKIGEHSTGQQKKIQIVAGMAALTELIVVDEVTAVLDPATRQKFFLKLKEHNQKFGTTILLATNVVADLKSYSNKILFIKKGEAIVSNPQEIEQLFGVKNV